jgi:hypothetical protein
MTKTGNPAPRGNAEGRANSKSQRRDNNRTDENREARPGPIDFEAINKAAVVALPAVLARVLPRGKRVGSEYLALNPRRVDRSLGSFKVNCRTGRWADFATGDKGGDVISLVAYLKDISQYEAAKGLSHMLGVGRRR